MFTNKLKPFLFVCLPFGAASQCLAQFANVNLVFDTQQPIDVAIVLPDLSYGSGDYWFAQAQYGPFPDGIHMVNYQNPDYKGLNYALMGTDTEANGATGFFVGVPYWEVPSVQGQSFDQVFPDWAGLESSIISDFAQGLDQNGNFNSYDASYFMHEYDGFNVGGPFGLLYLVSFSDGSVIGTVNFQNPSGTPAPFAAAPFAIGLLGKLRRRVR